MADYATKQWALTTLKNEPPVSVLPILQWAYVENKGAAFGMFAESSSAGLLLLMVVTIVITFVLLLMFYQSQSTFLTVALSFILGGALGNLYDRINEGYVIDFIDVYWQQYHWPAFNIADIAIIGGAFLCAIDLLFLQDKNKVCVDSAIETNEANEANT